MKNQFGGILKNSILTGIMLLAGFYVKAQFVSDYLRAADNYFKKGDYFSAAQYYEKYLNANANAKQVKYDPYAVASGPKEKGSKKVSKEEVTFKAGESYRLLNNYVKAEPFYKEVAGNQQLPLARYWYAKSLKSNSKFDEASAEFNKFMQEYSTDDAYKQDADREMKNLQFMQAQFKKDDVNSYTINKMPVNGTGATSAPVLLAEKLVFNSTRPTDESSKGPFINRLYEASMDGGNVTKMDVPQAGGEHLEGATFTPDGNKLFVTKWMMNNEKKTAGIYTSTKQGDKWSPLVALDNNVNADGYSSQQPFLSKDGSTLYFSSNKPGGSGGFDIWMAPVDNSGNPGASVNLGTTINTAADEYAPFFFAPSNSLVFSCNGRVGMGGFDFFEAKKSADGWEEPVNMGYPVNSVKDEIYMTTSSKKYLLDNFYFSSDRGSECCLELYSGSKTRAKKIVTGFIIDCLTGHPLEGVDISVLEDVDSNATVSFPKTNAQGRYEVLLDEYKPLKVKAQAEGYIAKEIDFKKSPQSDTLMTITTCLEQPGKKPFEAENKPIVIENIYFDFDKATLRPESFPVLDSVVGLMQRYPTMAIEVSGHTDSKGQDDYNQKLSEERAKAFVDYCVSKGIEAERMQWKGFGEARPIAPNTVRGKDNPEGRQKNRRTEIKVLHY